MRLARGHARGLEVCSAPSALLRRHPATDAASAPPAEHKQLRTGSAGPVPARVRSRRDRYDGAVELLAFAMFTSINTFVTGNNSQHRALSLGGRIYRSVYSFTILLTLSSYTANLAAVLARRPLRLCFGCRAPASSLQAQLPSHAPAAGLRAEGSGLNSPRW